MGCGEGRCIANTNKERQCMKWAIDEDKAVWDDNTFTTYHIEKIKRRTCAQHRSQEPPI